MIEASHWTKVQDWPEWCENFTPAELACRGTGAVKIDEVALSRLQRLRNHLGAPLIINSAYRSPQHNRAVGGAENSYHMKGCAFDIDLANLDGDEVEEVAREFGFTGIGRYLTEDGRADFIHVDTGPEREWGAKAWPVDRETRFRPEPKRKPPAKRAVDPKVITSILGGIAGMASQLGAWPAVAVVGIAALSFLAYIFHDNLFGNEK